jgi:hypothetical protein
MAAGSTYVPIANQVLTSATASVTFSSIPSTYTDLVLIANGGVSTLGSITIQLNSDTGTNYSYTRVYGNGSAATSDRFTSQNYLDLGYFPNSFGNSSITHFMNYSNTSTYKTTITRWATTSYTTAEVGLWRNTAAINSIVLYNSSSYNLNAGSTFTLYGIQAA